VYKLFDWVTHHIRVMLGYDSLGLILVFFSPLCDGFIALRFMVVSVELVVLFSHLIFFNYWVHRISRLFGALIACYATLGRICVAYY